MTIDMKNYVEAEKSAGGKSTKEKPSISIRTKTGKINISSMFGRKIEKSARFKVFLAKDKKSVFLQKDKDGKTIGSLILSSGDLEKIGLDKDDFTIQFFSRFEKSDLVIDLEKSLLTKDNSKK